MSSAKTQPARGMRDFLPEDVRKREYVIGVIKEVYERYGFEPLETPAVENIETLMGKYGEEGNQLIFKILKRGVHEGTGEADLALRYDLTVPLARVVAEYRDKLPKFFKRYQIQPVWRADRPARGRFREFYQCDVDVLGSRSMVVEAEICAVASEVLSKLGFGDFTIRLNHRQVLAGLLKAFGVAPDKQTEALVTIDKREKIGDGGVVKELMLRGVSGDAAFKTLAFFSRMSNADVVRQELIGSVEGAFGSETVTQAIVPSVNEQVNDRLLNQLKEEIHADELVQQGLGELESIIKLTKVNGSGPRIRIDPGLARGLSYYTGAIMEISVSGIGSLGGGGRYDNLVGMFLGHDVPACGFSLGLERIIVVMTERGMFPPHLTSAPADVMVTIWNEESIGHSIALARELRSKGLRVDLYPEADKLAKQFKYASSRGIPFVTIIGDDERARGEVSIKDMRSGEQRSVKREDVANALQNRER
jgi:histidyl-tRNA synthetase